MCKRIFAAVLMGLLVGVPACIHGYQARQAQLRWNYYNVPQGRWVQELGASRLTRFVAGVPSLGDDGQVLDTSSVEVVFDDGRLWAITCDDDSCELSSWDAPPPDPEDDLLGGFCMDDYDSPKLPKKPPAPGKIADCYESTYIGSNSEPWLMYFILLDDGSVFRWRSAVKGTWMPEGMQAIGAGLLWGAGGAVLGALTGVALVEILVRIRDRRKKPAPDGPPDAT